MASTNKYIEKKTFKNVKKIKDCPKKYGNKKISAMSWLNVAISYGDLFYTTKSLPYFLAVNKFSLGNSLIVNKIWLENSLIFSYEQNFVSKQPHCQ